MAISSSSSWLGAHLSRSRRSWWREAFLWLSFRRLDEAWSGKSWGGKRCDWKRKLRNGRKTGDRLERLGGLLSLDLLDHVQEFEVGEEVLVDVREHGWGCGCLCRVLQGLKEMVR